MSTLKFTALNTLLVDILGSLANGMSKYFYIIAVSNIYCLCTTHWAVALIQKDRIIYHLCTLFILSNSFCVKAK